MAAEELLSESKHQLNLEPEVMKRYCDCDVKALLTWYKRSYCFGEISVKPEV